MVEENCIFCKIIIGDIPSDKLYETDKVYAFMDINPLSEGHFLVIPKEHAEKMHQLSDDGLSEILQVIKKLVVASGVENYNVLQNNGKIAHQVVMHVHFHMIPRFEKDGLAVKWVSKTGLDQKGLAEKIRNNL